MPPGRQRTSPHTPTRRSATHAAVRVRASMMRTTAPGSSLTRVIAVAATLVVLVAAVVVVARSQTEPTPAREISATEAGQAAARRILQLPVPLHQAAREALEAIAEAQLAIANPHDGAALAVARAHVQQARINIMLREGDPGISPQQRTATADLNRQLQRLLISVDAAGRD